MTRGEGTSRTSRRTSGGDALAGWRQAGVRRAARDDPRRPRRDSAGGGLFCSTRVGDMNNYTTTTEGRYMATESGMSPRQGAARTRRTRTTRSTTGRWERSLLPHPTAGLFPRGGIHFEGNIMGAFGGRSLLSGRHQPLVPLDATCERYLHNLLGEDQDALLLGRGRGETQPRALRLVIYF